MRTEAQGHARRARPRVVTGALATGVVAALGWVLLKPAPSAVASALNRSLFVALAIATGVFWVARMRAIREPEHRIACGVAFAVFLSATVLFAFHFAAVLSLPLRAESFAYSFHLYSLLLLGAVGTTTGVAGLRAVRSLALSEVQAEARLRRALIALLLVNIPLIPLQDFAIALSLAGAGVLGLARRTGSYLLPGR